MIWFFDPAGKLERMITFSEADRRLGGAAQADFVIVRLTLRKHT
jgi:hypothetical protein